MGRVQCVCPYGHWGDSLVVGSMAVVGECGGVTDLVLLLYLSFSFFTYRGRRRVTLLGGGYLGEALKPGIINRGVCFTCTVTLPCRAKGVMSTRIRTAVGKTRNACLRGGSCRAGTRKISIPIQINGPYAGGSGVARIRFYISAYTTALECCCGVPRRTHKRSISFAFSTGTSGNRAISVTVKPCTVTGVRVGHGLGFSSSSYCVSVTSVRVCGRTRTTTGPSEVSLMCI